MLCLQSQVFVGIVGFLSLDYVVGLCLTMGGVYDLSEVSIEY